MISYVMIVARANNIAARANTLMNVNFLIVLIQRTGIRKVIAIRM